MKFAAFERNTTSHPTKRQNICKKNDWLKIMIRLFCVKGGQIQEKVKFPSSSQLYLGKVSFGYFFL